MQNLVKFAFSAIKPHYSNVSMRKLMKLQQQQLSMKKAFSFVNLNKSSLSNISSFKFSTENKCKNNADKICENKGGCHSKQHNHDHHHHENGCCDHGKASTTTTQPEDADITKLKDLLNSFAKDGNHHEHTHDEHGCCGGNHDHHHHHEHNPENMSNHNHVQNKTHQHNQPGNHHHHHHDHEDGCCGHDHSHDHHHHKHNHEVENVDLEAIAKQKVIEQEFALRSGEQVKAVYSGGNTVSYSLNDTIKGVKAREAEHGQLVMIFTCTVCETRSARSFTKKAYNEGIVLIRCETCDSLHLVADNLGWFNDEKSNIETIMEEKGEKVHKIDNSESINDILAHFLNKEEPEASKTNNS